MFNYFRGWKRKAGLVTLVIACLFAAGWLRSHSYIDIVASSAGGMKSVCMSGSQKLRLIFPGKRMLQMVVAIQDPDEGERTHGWIIAGAPWETKDFSIRSEVGRIVKVNSLDVKNEQFLLIPYWSIVIPLTLLSAWLLLSKPGAKRTSRDMPAAD